MRHIIFILFFLSVLTGFASVLVLGIHTHRNKSGMGRFHLLFSCLLTVKILIDNIVVYIWANVAPSVFPLNTTLINYTISMAVSYFIVFLTPIYLHEMTGFPFKKSANLAVFILAAVTGIALIMPYIMLFLQNGWPNRLSGEPLFRVAFIILLGYILTLILIRYKKLRERKLFFIALMAAGNFIIFGILDNYLIKKMLFESVYPSGLELHILLYLLWSLYFLIVSIKGFGFHQNIAIPASIPEEFYKQHDLTGREREIFERLLKGDNNGEIAKELFISFRTVKNHVYNIYKKTGVKNRIELINLLRK